MEWVWLAPGGFSGPRTQVFKLVTTSTADGRPRGRGRGRGYASRDASFSPKVGASSLSSVGVDSPPKVGVASPPKVGGVPQVLVKYFACSCLLSVTCDMGV